MDSVSNFFPLTHVSHLEQRRSLQDSTCTRPIPLSFRRNDEGASLRTSLFNYRPERMGKSLLEAGSPSSTRSSSLPELSTPTTEDRLLYFCTTSGISPSVFSKEIGSLNLSWSKIHQEEPREIKELEPTTRGQGGFGSTGVNILQTVAKQLEEKEEPVGISLHLRTTVRLPPLSQQKVHLGRVTIPANHGALFEADADVQQRHLILIEHAVYPKKSGQLIMPTIINPTDKEVTLDFGTKIGTLYTDWEECDGTEKQEVICNLMDEIPVLSTTHRRHEPIPDFQAKLKIGPLPPGDRERLVKLLEEYMDVFAEDISDLGRIKEVQHRIYVGDAKPVKQRPYRRGPHENEFIQQEIQRLLQNGLIQRSYSPWASPIALARKKDGSYRFCIDYRKLNAVTKKDAYPVPLIDEIFDHFGGSKIFITLDAHSGYWQVEMDPADAEKTAFTSKYGIYEYTVMPFGLCNLSTTYGTRPRRLTMGYRRNLCRRRVHLLPKLRRSLRTPRVSARSITTIQCET
jgi:hypothetical protein